MRESLLTILRDKNTKIFAFRKASEKLASLLAQDTFQYLKEKSVKVKTPCGLAAGKVEDNKIILLPIWRAGLAFLNPFLYYFPQAKIGFLGIKRNEKTALPKKYYVNIPQINSKDKIIILDPMLATGGTIVKTLQILKNKKVKQSQIIFVSLICAPEGLNNLKKNFPKIKIVLGFTDKHLNKDKFIIPGLGDFGDRYFGTL